MPTWKMAVLAIPRLLVIAIPFVCAGRVDWPRGWLCVGLLILTLAVNMLVIRAKNPGLLRARPTRGSCCLIHSLVRVQRPQAAS